MIPHFPSYAFINDMSLGRESIANMVESEMEIGPQKRRPKQSVPMFVIPMEISICLDKLSSFNSWYLNDLKSGAYWFTMKDPFDGVTRRFRFISTPSWKKTGVNTLTTPVSFEAYDVI